MKPKRHLSISLLAACLLTINSAVAQFTSGGAGKTVLTNINDFVGIGTNNPLFKLDIQGSGISTMSFRSTNNNASILLDRGSSGSTSSLTYRTLGVNNWQTGIISNDNYTIRNNGLASPAITILFANNNVGIGVANPTEKLNVGGNISATGNINSVNLTGSGTVSGSTVTSTGNVNAVNFIGTGNIDVNGYVGFGSVEQLTDGGANTIASNSNLVPLVDCGSNLGTSNKRWNNILACGNIGIGITAPVTKLHITGGTNSNLTTGGYVILGDLLSTSISIDDNEIIARNNGAVSPLSLNNTGGNVLISAAGSGNVGIGTSSPAQRLHVRQNVSNRAIEWQHESTSDFWTVGIGTASLNARFEFNGSGKAQISSVDGTYSTISDIRLKEDITPMNSIIDKVMRLIPSNYYYTSSRNMASNKSTGFIAQEVEKVFPELIHNDDEGYKWLSYSEFSVIAIKAIQEQQKIIEEKTNELSSLKNQVDHLNAMMEKFDQALSQCCMSYNEKNSAASQTDIATLEQNQPNPFNKNSVIKYYIPSSFETAQLVITDLSGVQLKSFSISQSGFGQVIINANNLSSGTYLYSLIINNSKIDTKKMELTK